MENAKTISHAFAVLNEAAQGSSEEIRDIVNKDLRRVKNALSEYKPEVKSAFREIRDASTESVTHMRDAVVDTAKQAAKKVDGVAHENPWILAGASVLLAGLAGYSLGKTFSRR